MDVSFAVGVAALTSSKLQETKQTPKKTAPIGPAPLPQLHRPCGPIEARIKARQYRCTLSKRPEYAFLQEADAPLSLAFEMYIYEIFRGTGKGDAAAIVLESILVHDKQAVKELLVGDAAVQTLDEMWLGRQETKAMGQQSSKWQLEEPERRALDDEYARGAYQGEAEDEVALIEGMHKVTTRDSWSPLDGDA